MTDQAMSPLRRRMIEDMTIRKLAPKTQQGYIRTIRDFAAFLGRSPDTANFEDVRRFQLHLAAKGAHIPILNHTVAALRFFFRVTLKRSDIIDHTTFLHEPRKLPVVLSPEEVARLLDAAPGLKYKAALSGLRRGFARRRADLAQDRRHRQQAHGHPRRARQRP
jgi:integrase/recombinase XerD